MDNVAASCQSSAGVIGLVVHASVGHAGERLLNSDLLRSPWTKWRRQRETVCVHQVLVNGLPLYLYSNNPQVKPLWRMFLPLLFLPSMLLSSFLACCNGEAVASNASWIVCVVLILAGLRCRSL